MVEGPGGEPSREVESRRVGSQWMDLLADPTRPSGALSLLADPTRPSRAPVETGCKDERGNSICQDGGGTGRKEAGPAGTRLEPWDGRSRRTTCRNNVTMI